MSKAADKTYVGSIEVQGFKKIKGVVEITLNKLGLTVLEGPNRAGKTSIADAVEHCLVGPSSQPAGASLINDSAREGEPIKGSRGALAQTTVETVGATPMKVTRKLTEQNGRKGVLFQIKQTDIDKVINKIALHPPDMTEMTERQRTDFLLKAVDVDLSSFDDRITEVEKERQNLYTEKDLAQKHSKDLPPWPDAPAGEVDISAKSKELAQAHETNNALHQATVNAQGEIQQLFTEKANLVSRYKTASNDATALEQKMQKIRDELEEAVEMVGVIKQKGVAVNEKITAAKSVETAAVATEVQEEIDTTALAAEIESADLTNQHVRANVTKAEKMATWGKVLEDWHEKGREINKVRVEMAEVINGADLPIKSLAIEIDEGVPVITFAGQRWSGMSGMQRKAVQVMIGSLYNPQMPFVIVDGLEVFDHAAEVGFHKLLTKRGLQALATKVADRPSEGDDGIVRLFITDGKVVKAKAEKKTPPPSAD